MSSIGSNKWEMKRQAAVRIVATLNRLGPLLGSETSHSINPLAELMTFYWFEAEQAVSVFTGQAKNPGWLGYVHYNRQWFIELADCLLPKTTEGN